MKDNEGELILEAVRDLKGDLKDTRADIADQRKDIKELTAKVEKTITKTEVLQSEHDSCKEARCKEIDDHLKEHDKSRTYLWGLAAAVGLLGLKELVTFWGGSK